MNNKTGGLELINIQHGWKRTRDPPQQMQFQTMISVVWESD